MLQFLPALLLNLRVVADLPLHLAAASLQERNLLRGNALLLRGGPALRERRPLRLTESCRALELFLQETSGALRDSRAL